MMFGYLVSSRAIQQSLTPGHIKSWLTYPSKVSTVTKIDQSITSPLKTWPISGSHRIFWGVSDSHRVLRGSHSQGWPLVGTLHQWSNWPKTSGAPKRPASACSSAPTPTTTIRGLLTESILWFRHFPCSPSRKRWEECNTFKVVKNWREGVRAKLSSCETDGEKLMKQDANSMLSLANFKGSYHLW